eukprot:CAMPEP_0179247170 /NCGR_PEP_ID=MMETSP0797-20121207/19470_1 /TAXON_ID=47934 /ORGANISM="Dinophysis acuminata, Strain DAEP01" /LENGTH=166 /DNA_ID=CAMNT_0020954779 /DNA_START=87 /DNA_END=584 /DNA_ORIENTATION=-
MQSMSPARSAEEALRPLAGARGSGSRLAWLAAAAYRVTLTIIFHLMLIYRPLVGNWARLALIARARRVFTLVVRVERCRIVHHGRGSQDPSYIYTILARTAIIPPGRRGDALLGAHREREDEEAEAECDAQAAMGGRPANSLAVVLARRIGWEVLPLDVPAVCLEP